MNRFRFALVCGFGVYFRGKFYGEKVNGNIVDICDKQIITGIQKLLCNQVDYAIFSGGCTKKLPLKKGEAPLSEAMSMKNRALELFPGYRKIIERKVLLEERAFHSYQNLERSWELIADKSWQIESLEIISLACKEPYFDVYVREVELASISPLTKNFDYFFCPVGEMSRSKSPYQVARETKKFTEKYERPGSFVFSDHEFFRLAVKRDIYNTVYSRDFQRKIRADSMKDPIYLIVNVKSPFIGLKL